MPNGDNLNADRAAVERAIDVSKPNIARVYDYWLGGKNNFAADRDQAERMLAVYPLLGQRVRENRLFLAKAVSWLARQGVRQFLDIGSGLPTARNTHEIAQDVDPACRVVYVDCDPVVVNHAVALLSGPNVAAIEGDLRDAGTILADPEVVRLIRSDEPLGLILASVLHFFDVQTVRDITEPIIRSIAPGSYVVISVGSGDKRTGGNLTSEYSAAMVYNHSPEQVAGFMADLELVGPAPVDAKDWDPLLATTPPVEAGGRILAVVGRKKA